MPKKNHITLSQRLALLGLEDRESELKNLNVKEGTELRLSSKDPRHAKRIAQIPVKSARELKRLLGVPDGAIGQDTPPKAHPEGFVSTLNGLPFLPFPAVPLMDKETVAHLMSYVLSATQPQKRTVAEKKLFSRLDKAVREAGIAILVVLAADIHVEEGATLVVDDSIQTLFGNHIILEEGATIIMESTISRIDCARIRFVQS